MVNTTGFRIRATRPNRLQPVIATVNDRRTLRSTAIKPETPASQTAATAYSPKILVVEDSADLRDAIVLIFREQGYQVQTARDGLEATTMVPEFEPDLVILDLRMPRMSGSNACAAIRKTSNVPIIMFTSSDNAAEVRDAISKGATDFVLKSTGISVLTERVKFHLAKLKLLPQNNAVAATATRTPDLITAGNQDSTNPGNTIRTTSLIIDPDEGSRDIVKAVLTRLNQTIIEVGTAAEAIAAFKKHRPQILFTEWSLPDMDSFSMLSEMKRGRSARSNKNVYKFIMSVRLSPEAHRKARFVGITDFLYKPLDGAKVEQLVADCVRQALRNLKRKAARAA